MLDAHWKMTADDLRSRAVRVTSELETANLLPGGPKMSARLAAKVLAGIVRHVAHEWSVDIMQDACAQLARNEPTWDLARPNVISVPLDEHGQVPLPVRLIAVVAHGLLPIAGPGNIRDALAFWATEDDTRVMIEILNTPTH